MQYAWFPIWYQFGPNLNDWMKHNYSNLNIAKYAVVHFPENTDAKHFT